jgi:hypothetical protein
MCLTAWADFPEPRLIIVAEKLPMKHYLELLGLFAVSGCLALMINSAAVAHQPSQTPALGLVTPTQLRSAIAISRDQPN